MQLNPTEAPQQGVAAAKLEEKPSATGHTGTPEQVKVVDERNQGDRDFQIETLPALLA